MDAGIDRIDVFEHVVSAAAAHKLHGSQPRKAGQRLGSIPGIGHQRRPETRLDLVDDLDHLAQTALGPVRADPLFALNGVLAQPSRARDFFARRAKGFRDLARSKEAVVGISDQSHSQSPSVPNAAYSDAI